jgi:hypothetical protein
MSILGRLVRFPSSSLRNGAFKLNSFSISRSMSTVGVKVGDKIPIQVLQGVEDPMVKADSEYPEWLKTVHQKLPPATELKIKWDRDPSSLTETELRRLKRLVTLGQIKSTNLGI